MSKSIIKTTITVVIGLLIFVVFSMTRLSDATSLFVDYFKLCMLSENEIVNIKREPIKQIKNKDDIKGLWKTEDIAFENRYEALIDDNSIIIYKYEGDRKNIYWLGTFESKSDLTDFVSVDKENVDSINSNNQKITSKNYKQISKYLSMASQKGSMEFIYDEGVLKFTSQYNDDLYEVKLAPYIAYNERLRMVKYNNNREGEYNEVTNKEIILDNYEISYPNYFDVEEDNSRRDIPDNWVYNVNGEMKEKNLIILSPSNTKSFAELFVGEYTNVNIDSFEELKDYIIYNNENYSIDDSELVTYAFDTENNSIMHIFTTKYVDKYSGKIIYSLAFENWMLMKDTNEILNIGMSYTNDDVSEYDYIGDYEKIIKNIKEHNKN